MNIKKIKNKTKIQRADNEKLFIISSTHFSACDLTYHAFSRVLLMLTKCHREHEVKLHLLAKFIMKVMIDFHAIHYFVDDNIIFF